MIIEMCGLWKDDRDYLRGKAGGVKFYVFKNNKTSENSPDYRLCIGDGKGQGGNGGQGDNFMEQSPVNPEGMAGNTVPGVEHTPASRQPEEPENTDEQIPF